jgi:hypothetical protein
MGPTFYLKSPTFRFPPGPSGGQRFSRYSKECIEAGRTVLSRPPQSKYAPDHQNFWIRRIPWRVTTSGGGRFPKRLAVIPWSSIVRRAFPPHFCHCYSRVEADPKLCLSGRNFVSAASGATPGSRPAVAACLLHLSACWRLFYRMHHLLTIYWWACQWLGLRVNHTSTWIGQSIFGGMKCLTPKHA